MCLFMYFIKFRKFLDSISIFFSAFFPFCSPSGTLIIYMLICLMVSHKSLKPCSFFLVFFLIFRLGS